MFRYWKTLPLLLAVVGCSESPMSLSAEDQAAVAAYARYQSKIEPGIDMRIEAKLIAPARRIAARDVGRAVRALPASPYLVPYFVSASVQRDGRATLALEPRLERWGEHGYPAREADAAFPSPVPTETPVPGPTETPTPVPTETPAPTETPYPSPTPVCEGDACPTCDASLDGPYPEDETVDIPGTGGEGYGGTIPGTGGEGYGGLGFRAVEGAKLFTSRTMPSEAPRALSRVRVTLSSGAVEHSYDALVLHYANSAPVLVDRVLLGINDELALDSGVGQVAQAVESPWTKNTDGCQSYAFGYGKKVTWWLRNGWGFTIANPFVEASVQATMTCAAYDKGNNAKGCKVASYDGSPSTSGAGASYCFQNYYVTEDTGKSKVEIKDAANNIIGIDFSIGAAAHLVNTSNAQVKVKLEGKADGKAVGGNGQMTVKFDKPGGSYGGVEVDIDGELICPDWVKP